MSWGPSVTGCYNSILHPLPTPVELLRQQRVSKVQEDWQLCLRIVAHCWGKCSFRPWKGFRVVAHTGCQRRRGCRVRYRGRRDAPGDAGWLRRLRALGRRGADAAHGLWGLRRGRAALRCGRQTWRSPPPSTSPSKPPAARPPTTTIPTPPITPSPCAAHSAGRRVGLSPTARSLVPRVPGRPVHGSSRTIPSTAAWLAAIVWNAFGSLRSGDDVRSNSRPSRCAMSGSRTA